MRGFHSLALAGILSAAVVLGACEEAPPTAPEIDAEPAFQASSEWIREEFSFAFPFYLDCLDEEVIWSGTGVLEAHDVTTPDGSVQTNGRVSLAPGSMMVGASGTWVDPKVLNHFNIDNGNGNFHLNERITWTEQSSGVRMDVRTRTHVVVTGTGEVKILDDTGGATCEFR